MKQNIAQLESASKGFLSFEKIRHSCEEIRLCRFLFAGKSIEPMQLLTF